MTVASVGKSAGLLVGVDIGGTKTHFRAESNQGWPSRDLIVPSADWRKRDWDTDAVELLKLVHQFTEGAEIAAMGVGAHGCDDAAECMAFQDTLTHHVGYPLSVVNDAELMPLALGLLGQIGVVAGTGSIAVCRSAADRMIVAGGWGWIVSDEGSAASLVREAVRSVSQHLDRGGTLDEPLTSAVLEALDVKSVPRLGSMLHRFRSAAELGRHAVVVFDAAERGSLLAVDVISRGGRLLAELPAILDARGAGASHVVAGGSVIAAQPRLWDAFVQGLGESSPHLTPHLFKGSPVEGACYLASTLIQRKCSEACEQKSA
ncbi:N-acetylglucosamine kinase [Agrobacterium tumefaciens]|uniref:N-acetylglucosamine kinase n=1 Tax=Agrobacterium tumefaciens TaxID=358 RepID=UPI00220693CC|nr:sugar kinase [Agrobacterium tumefaciens]